MIATDSSDPRPLYVQIMGEIRRAIALGAMVKDEPLPSVRQLAAELQVNPNTVAQAYRALERAGTVYVRRGQGTFVARQAGSDGERRALATGVAERALREAFRHGLSTEDLQAAIRRVAATLPPTVGGVGSSRTPA